MSAAPAADSAEQVAPVPEHLAVDHAAGLGHEPEQRQQRHALARARLADEALRLARLEREAHAGRGHDRARAPANAVWRFLDLVSSGALDAAPHRPLARAARRRGRRREAGADAGEHDDEPGIVETHHAVSSSVWPSAMIAPTRRRAAARRGRGTTARRARGGSARCRRSRRSRFGRITLGRMCRKMIRAVRVAEARRREHELLLLQHEHLRRASAARRAPSRRR